MPAAARELRAARKAGAFGVVAPAAGETAAGDAAFDPGQSLARVDISGAGCDASASEVGASNAPSWPLSAASPCQPVVAKVGGDTVPGATPVEAAAAAAAVAAAGDMEMSSGASRLGEPDEPPPGSPVCDETSGLAAPSVELWVDGAAAAAPAAAATAPPTSAGPLVDPGAAPPTGRAAARTAQSWKTGHPGKLGERQYASW